MRVLFLTKRFYTNKDLIGDRFGRLFHFPVELSRRGHAVSVAALDYRGSAPESLEVDGVSFASVPMRGLGALRVWNRLRGLGDALQPDVVIGSADTPLGWMAQRLAARKGLPFVFDVYDNYGSFASSRFPGMKLLFRRLLGTADLVTAASEPLVRLAESHGGSATLIVNGVDKDVFRPIDRTEVRRGVGLGAEQKVVGYFGSIEPDRGIETLVESVQLLRESDPQVSLLVAGVDKSGSRWAPDWCDYRGSVPQSDVPALINACNVVVLPYLDNVWGDYTYPNKLAEYIACGVPVVATKVSGFAEVLADAAQGLCPPGDPAAMATAITAQLNEPVTVPVGTAASWTLLAEQLEKGLRHIGNG